MDTDDVASETVEVDSAPAETVDSTVLQAKILELTGVVESNNATISALQAEVNAAKAANYDLLMSIPANDSEQVEVEVNETDADVSIDDLFE